MENIYPPPFSVNHGQCLAAMQSAMRQKEESLLTLRHCLHAFPSRDNIEFSLWVKTPVLGVSPIADVLTSLCPAKFVQKTDYNLQTEESLRNPAWTHTRQKPPPFFSNSANEFTPFDVNNDILLYCISSYICLPVRGITHFYSAPIYFLSTSTAK